MGCGFYCWRFVFGVRVRCSFVVAFSLLVFRGWCLVFGVRLCLCLVWVVRDYSVECLAFCVYRLVCSVSCLVFRFGL